LGLALAREIAEAHGGRIQLANREGGGLIVTLDLPWSPASADATVAR
jgi:signal transduction histidine kinase